MNSQIGSGRPVATAEAELNEVRALERVLANEENISSTLVTSDGTSVSVPATVAGFMRRVVHALANEQAVQLVVYPRELMIHEVAALLGESHDTVERLLAEGQLPLTGDEAHRRVRLDDAVLYMERRDEQRREALRRLTELNQELGLYAVR
ncbi:MAG TPA: helix-turn-helix domain-containing protein [Thermomicrobiales bacterium]|nr:helix-turn-helix domain-containing protein [Thermomicrobiales bacterium]